MMISRLFAIWDKDPLASDPLSSNFKIIQKKINLFLIEILSRTNNEINENMK